MIIKNKEQEFYMDGKLHESLEKIRGVTKKDWDYIILVDGGEGSGKSVLTIQMAYYLDSTINLDRITFTAEEFTKAVINAEPYTAVVYDEAYTGLSSRGTMSTINKALVGMLAEIRQKNLYIFIVMPTFFDLDKYVALWRSRALIHVFAPNYERGYFNAYNAEAKKFLYIQGKKFYNYKAGKHSFHGRFTKFFPLDYDAYKKKKFDALKSREESNDKQRQELAKKKDEEYRSRILRNLMDMSEITNELKADIMGVSEQHYYRLVKAEKERMKSLDVSDNVFNKPLKPTVRVLT